MDYFFASETESEDEEEKAGGVVASENEEEDEGEKEKVFDVTFRGASGRGRGGNQYKRAKKTKHGYGNPNLTEP